MRAIKEWEPPQKSGGVEVLLRTCPLPTIGDSSKEEKESFIPNFSEGPSKA